MLKVVLINPPQRSSYPQPPLGLALIAAILEREKHQVTILDANVLRLTPEDVASQVTDADIVGLTAMTPTVNAAMSIARHLKQAKPNLPIIIGGAHATLLPGETLSSTPEIDVVVRGEGEQTVVNFLRAFEDGTSVKDVSNISFFHKGNLVNTPVAPMTLELDSLPFLAYHLLPWQRYRPHPPHGRALPFVSMVTSRGCPYHCSYCSKPIFGSKFRAQSPERVVEEVAYYKRKFNVKEIAFYDDVFTLNKKRAYEIADNILKRNIKISWTCETRVNLVDKELLQHMKKAGCYAIAYGVESASPDILKTLDKGINLEQVEGAVRLAQQAGIHTIGYFMLGSPGESVESIKKTIQFAKKLKFDFVQFAITTPYPSTKLYSIYMEGRTENVPWENFVYEGTGRKVVPVFETDGLKRDELEWWMKKAYKDFYLRPSYFWQRIRQLRSPGDLKVNLNGLSMLMQSIKK